MLVAHRSHLPAIICALAGALLAFATSGPTAAAANTEAQARSAIAQERYYSSYGAPQPRAKALAQERYYSSYGEPEPLTLPQSTAPSNDTPWLPIALSIAGALAVAGAGATQLRRLHIRRRAARVTA